MTSVKPPSYNSHKAVWVSAPSKHEAPFSRLHYEIQEFAEFIASSKEEMSQRRQIISKLADIVHSKWPSAQVIPYGSFSTGLALSFSDLDFVIMGVSALQQPLQPLFDLASGLTQSGLFDKLDVITTAKIPLIKTVHKASGIACDIVFGVQTGLQSCDLTKEYLKKYPELKPLTLFLKYYLYRRGLNSSYTGGLSSYQTLLLLVNHLQLNEDQASIHRDLGNTLINFLEFYGIQFDYEKFGIRIRGGGSYFEKSEKNWVNPHQRRALCIEDPHNSDHDLGRTVFEIETIRQHFEQSYLLLTSAVQSGRAKLLQEILPVDTTYCKYIRSMMVEIPNCSGKDSFRGPSNKKRYRDRAQHSKHRYRKSSVPKKEQEISQKA